MRSFEEVVLAPAVALMNRMRYAKKFLFIAAALLLPFGYTVHLQYAGSTASIDFNALERVGVEYIDPAKDLLAAMQRHRILQVAAISGDEGAASGLPAVDGAIGRLVGEVDTVDARYGAKLKTTERWTQIKQSWAALTRTRFATATDADKAHDGVTNSMIDLILNYAGNYSNLILDPDLDSYWLMDAWVIKMPLLGELTSEMATQTLIRDQNLTEQKVAIAGTYRMLRATSDDLMAVNMAVALKENKDGSLAPLEATFNASHKALVGYSDAIRAQTLGDHVTMSDGASQAVVAGALEAMNRSYALYDAIGPKLDGLCAARVAKYADARRSGLTAGAIAALLLSYLFSGFFMSVRRSVLGLRGATQRMIAGTTEVFALASRDEVGEIAGAYNQINTVLLEARALRARVQTILDNTGDGLLTCDRDGRIADTVSTSARSWFGPARVGETTVGRYLFEDEGARGWFEVGVGQLVEGVLPPEFAIDQMPARIRRNGRDFTLSYRPIFENGALSRLLIVVRDVTDELAARRSERDARDLQAVLANVLRDREGFRQFRREAEGLVAALTTATDVAAWKRDLHTLKGNLAVFGLSQLADQVHELESCLEERGSLDASELAALATSWHAALDKVSAFVAVEQDGVIEIREEDLRAFLRALEETTDRVEIRRMAERWRTTPAAVVLERLGAQARRIADRVGKQVECEVVDHGVRLEKGTLGPFWTSLVHVVRNAIDHGIEEPAERSARGKSDTGTLRFESSLSNDSFVVTIADDGRGVDWDRVREKAEKLGLSAETRADLERALFCSGLTTKEQVTQLSGRGVGLDAVLQTCRELGGYVDVESTPGQGTRIVFRFPIRELGVSLPAA